MSNETYCAVVENNVVTNMLVIAADSPLLADNPNWIYIGTNPKKVAIGWTYDGTDFYPPQPYPSWVWNSTTWKWDPPVPYPTDGKVYYWDEATQSWIAYPGQ